MPPPRVRQISLAQASRESLPGTTPTRTRQAASTGFRRFAVESDWRDETIRMNLWLIPAIESVAAVLPDRPGPDGESQPGTFG
jgi:hypothetical protein